MNLQMKFHRNFLLLTHSNKMCTSSSSKWTISICIWYNYIHKWTKYSVLDIPIINKYLHINHFFFYFCFKFQGYFNLCYKIIYIYICYVLFLFFLFFFINCCILLIEIISFVFLLFLYIAHKKYWCKYLPMNWKSSNK